MVVDTYLLLLTRWIIFPLLSIINSEREEGVAVSMDNPGSRCRTRCRRFQSRPDERAGGVDDIVNTILMYMLKVVYMSANIHVHFVFQQYPVHFFLHVLTFATLFWRLGIDGVVACHNRPVCIVIAAEFVVEPSQLSVDILPAYIMILSAVGAIFFDYGSSVDEYDFYTRSIIFEYSGIISRRHRPSAA